MDHNLKIFNRLAELIGIEKEIRFTSTYELDPVATDMRFLVEAKKVKVPSLDTYTQVLEASHGFIPNLTILDLLFNEGPNTLTYLENQNLKS